MDHIDMEKRYKWALVGTVYISACYVWISTFPLYRQGHNVHVDTAEASLSNPPMLSSSTPNNKITIILLSKWGGMKRSTSHRQQYFVRLPAHILHW